MSLHAHFPFLHERIEGRSSPVQPFSLWAEIPMVQVINIDIFPLKIFEGLLKLLTYVKGVVCVFRCPAKMSHLGGDDVILRTKPQFLQTAG